MIRIITCSASVCVSLAAPGTNALAHPSAATSNGVGTQTPMIFFSGVAGVIREVVKAAQIGMLHGLIGRHGSGCAVGQNGALMHHRDAI